MKPLAKRPCIPALEDRLEALAKKSFQCGTVAEHKGCLNRIQITIDFYTDTLKREHPESVHSAVLREKLADAKQRHIAQKWKLYEAESFRAEYEDARDELEALNAA